MAFRVARAHLICCFNAEFLLTFLPACTVKRYAAKSRTTESIFLFKIQHLMGWRKEYLPKIVYYM